MSTTGFTVSSHYCGTHLVDVSINSAPDSCNENGCCANCCHEETKHFQLDDNYTKAFDFASPTPLVFIIPIVHLFINEQIDETVNYAGVVFTPPPPPLNTRLSLFQSYLN